MKKTRIAALLLALVWMLCSCGERPGGSASSQGPVEFEAQTWTMICGGEGSPEYQAAQRFSERLFEKTHGTVQVQCVSLREVGDGSYQTAIEALQAGAVDIIWGSAAEFAAIDARLDAPGLPFLFLSREEAESAMDGDGGAAMGEILRENGFQCLGIGTEGFRILTNSQRAVESKADLAGLRIRVGGGDVVEESLQSWGAETVDAPWAGVYTALETGIYDGQEEYLETADAASIQKVQGYACNWPAFYGAAYLCMDAALYDSLAERLAGIAADCGAEASQVQREQFWEDSDTILSAWRKARVKISTLNEDALAEFREASRSCWDAFSGRYPAELVARLCPAEGN